MKAIEELTRGINKPRLVPTFKQPERNLLSVFMSLIELVPVIRGEFLKLCKYSSGKTCTYQSGMEANYNGPKMPDVRPDGVLACKRGAVEWAAFIEAKAGNSPIRTEQIIDYLDLASKLDVQTIITISNEFARVPEELPYNIPAMKRRKRKIFHFAWADIRTFLEGQTRNSELSELEAKILSECLEFFWGDTSGVITFDAMPIDWPKFVESSGIGIGFGSKTPGITEIVHGWVQERRDLCSKLIHKTHLDVTLGHDAGAKSDADQRLKLDRKTLADDYSLSAQYIFKKSKVKILTVANLRARKTTVTLQMSAPQNKKAIATVNWIVSLAHRMEIMDAFVFFDWKGRAQSQPISVVDMLENPEFAYEGQKDAPKSIHIIRVKQDVRRFKSRKKFIEDIEDLTISTVLEAQRVGWLVE